MTDWLTDCLSLTTAQNLLEIDQMTNSLTDRDLSVCLQYEDLLKQT